MKDGCTKDNIDRLKNFVTKSIIIIALVLMQILLTHMGHGIKCIFHLITGLQCPGCGVSHMAMHIMDGNMKQAFKDNPVVLVGLPVLAWIFIRRTITYIQTGDSTCSRAENVCLQSYAIVLLIFGILRNFF